MPAARRAAPAAPAAARAAAVPAAAGGSAGRGGTGGGGGPAVARRPRRIPAAHGGGGGFGGAAAPAARRHGRRGAGGTGGTGGAGGATALAAASVLDGQAWVLRCGEETGARRCTSANAITNNYPSSDPLGGRVSRNDFGAFGGVAGSPYCVTVRVQGITASKSYVTDSVTNRSGAPYGIAGTASFGTSFDADGNDGSNGWVAGGMPGTSDNHSVNALLVGSPLQIYYLNSIAFPGEARTNDTSYVVDYTATLPDRRRLVVAVHRRRLRRHHRRQLLARPDGQLHPLRSRPAARRPRAPRHDHRESVRRPVPDHDGHGRAHRRLHLHDPRRV